MGGKFRSYLKVDPTVLRERVRTRLEATPGRLGFYLVVLTVVAALAGLSALIASVQRSGLIDDVINRSGPLAVQSQQLYRSLSDADAAAAAEFLTSAAESPALRVSYQEDIAAASAALTAVASSADETQQAAVGGSPRPCRPTPAWSRRPAPRTGSTSRSARPTCVRRRR